MSYADDDTSDIQKAAEQANSQQIEKNLKEGSSVDAPQSLAGEEKTPFIDEELRTDK